MWRLVEAATCLSKDDLAQRKLFVNSENATVMNSSLRLRLLRRRKERRGAIRFVRVCLQAPHFGGKFKRSNKAAHFVRCFLESEGKYAHLQQIKLIKMLGTSGLGNSIPSLPILGAAFIGCLSTDSLRLPFVLPLSKLLPVAHFSPFNGNRSFHLFR